MGGGVRRRLTWEQIPQPMQRSSDRTAILSSGVTSIHNLPETGMKKHNQKAKISTLASFFYWDIIISTLSVPRKGKGHLRLPIIVHSFVCIYFVILSLFPPNSSRSSSASSSSLLLLLSKFYFSRRFDGASAIFFKGDAFWTKLTLQYCCCYYCYYY